MALSEVKGVSGSDLIKIAAAVVMDVQRLGYGGFLSRSGYEDRGCQHDN